MEELLVNKNTNVNAKWYALRVVSGKEKQAIKNLEVELKISGLDKHVSNLLLPIEKEFKLKKGKKVSRERLTFPGYLLLQAELNGEINRLVKKTNLVVEFIGDKNGPSALRQSEVDLIIGKIEENANNDYIPFIINEIVTITDGPFTTFKGEIINVDESKQKLTLNVSIFGRITPVELNYMQVEKSVI